MRRVAALGVVLFLTACSGKVPVPVSVPTVESAPAPSGTGEQSADSLSDESFRLLQAKRYKEAFEAGNGALRLNPDHPYALYNVGIAQLELGATCQALSTLAKSAQLQPGRYEPLVALARGYVASYEPVPAAAKLAEARAAGAPAHELQPVQASLEALRQGPLPADLAKTAVKLNDGDVTLYLYPETTIKGCGSKVYSFYAVPKAGEPSKLPLGSLPNGEGAWQAKRAELPGGVVGYWLQTPTLVYVHVSHSSDWRLFTYQGGALNQVLFSGREAAESQDQPRISGDQIEASRANTSSGITTWVTTYQLAPDLRTASTVGKEEQAIGVIKALDHTITIQMDTKGRGSVNTSGPLTFTRPLAGNVTVLKGGQPVPQTELKVGQIVMIRDRGKDGLIIEIR